MPQIELSQSEIELLREALDSHKYWQLSDKSYRSDGYVMDPGSDDPDSVEAIAACDMLADKLGSGVS